VAGYIPRWFTHLQMVIYPSINWAQHRVTKLLDRAQRVTAKAGHTTRYIPVVHCSVTDVCVGDYSSEACRDADGARASSELPAHARNRG